MADADKPTTERVALVTAFLGLAYWAHQCPCAIIFKCHRPQVLAALAGIFLWIFARTAPTEPGELAN